MSPKKKIYLWLIIFVGISLYFLILVIPKLLGEIRKNSEDLISLNGELISLQKETENLNELEKIYQNYQPNLFKIDELFIDPETPIDFINFLEKNAQLSQLKIEISLAPKKEIKTDPWPSLFFKVPTYGSLPNFLRFLEKMENSPYLIEIVDLNIKRLAERDAQLIKYPGLSPGDVESNLSIKVFTH